MKKIQALPVAVWGLVACGAALFAHAPVKAQEERTRVALPSAEEGAPWTSLSAQQRSALAPLQPQWASLSLSTKDKWIALARRMSSMKRPERERIQERMTDWAQLTPVERGQRRLYFQEARQVAPEVRSEQWKRYNELSDDEKRQLAARAVPATGTSSVSASRSRPAAIFVNDAPAASKINTTPASPAALPRRIAPSVLQAQPGATTTLISSRPTPPPHQPAGMPKIAASASSPAAASIFAPKTDLEALNRP
jgi:hypothetical protein